MKTLAELLRGQSLAFEGENEGAGGTPTSETPPTSEGEAPAASATSAVPEVVESSTTPAKADWKDRRLAQLTARLSQANAQLAQATTPPAPDVNATFDALVTEQATRQAAAIAARASFDEKCNAAAEIGRTKFGKAAFDDSLSQLLTLVDRTSSAELANYQEFLASAIETGEAAKIIYDLGRDPDEAARVLALSPRKMTIELAKMTTTGKDPGVSAAPRPITPIDAKGGRHDAIAASDAAKADTLDTKTWMARRNAEIAAQPKRY